MVPTIERTKGKVAVFLPSLHVGGAERVMVDLVCGFGERGVAVDLLLADASGAFLAEIPHGVRIIDLGAGRILASLPGVVRYLRQERPAAVLAGLHHANVVALLARRLSGVTTRVVVTVHDAMSYGATYSPNLRQRLIPYLIGRFYPGADAVVAVSKGVADDLARTTGVARERITVIYNPVVTPDVARRADAPPDPARFRAWYAAGRAPVILSVGRLAPEKDFSTLIRAFAGLSDNLPARLLILGEGPERAQLEALIDALALGERVALPGFVANPFAHMARAGVFVLSSTFEGLPSALIQAMACGCPVVATDCPHGPAEILAGGRHGRLVPIGDVAAMTKAVADALTAPRNAEALRARTAPFAAGPSTERYLEVLGLAGSGG